MTGILTLIVSPSSTVTSDGSLSSFGGTKK